MRLIAFLVGLVFVGCAPKPAEIAPNSLDIAPRVFDSARARETLKASADETIQAIFEGDHERLANFTHTRIVEGMGGRTRFKQRMAEMAAEFRANGINFEEIEAAEPSDIVESSGQYFAIVPFKARMKFSDGAVASKPSHLIAISMDDGASWKFVDGDGIGADREKLARIFPEVPDELVLPPIQEIKFEAE